MSHFTATTRWARDGASVSHRRRSDPASTPSHRAETAADHRGGPTEAVRRHGARERERRNAGCGDVSRDSADPCCAVPIAGHALCERSGANPRDRFGRGACAKCSPGFPSVPWSVSGDAARRSCNVAGDAEGCRSTGSDMPLDWRANRTKWLPSAETDQMWSAKHGACHVIRRPHSQYIETEM